jgi:hypothetical protein
MGAAEAAGPPRSYVRHGRVLHRAGCFAALGGTPWEWAEGMTAVELAEHPAASGYRQCEYCMPERMWPHEPAQPDPGPPLLERVRLAHEHLTRAVELDLDKARWLERQGELAAAANAQRTAWDWEQAAKVLASYVPELLDDGGGGDAGSGGPPAQTMPE